MDETTLTVTGTEPHGLSPGDTIVATKMVRIRGWARLSNPRLWFKPYLPEELKYTVTEATGTTITLGKWEDAG